jgi:mannose-1-phosphate guanylyltransferase
VVQAVVLAGGLGTRLRPITLTRPKPLLPILNRPLILRVMDLLPPQVDEVFIATGYMGDKVADLFKREKTRWKVEVVNEERPLGTGGALKNLEKCLHGKFIVLNGDVICSLDLRKMLRFHEQKKGMATISLWDVEDPTAYGMVVLGPEGHIREFREKPRREEVVSHAINAGTYILEPEILRYMEPGRETSIEKEVFPKVLARGLYGYRFEGHWFDAGTLNSYLRIHASLLNDIRGGIKKGAGSGIPRTVAWSAPVLLGERCVIGERSRIGPRACLGDRVIVGQASAVRDSVIHDGATIGDRVLVEQCLVGENATIESDVVLAPGTIVGDGQHLELRP